MLKLDIISVQDNQFCNTEISAVQDTPCFTYEPGPNIETMG